MKKVFLAACLALASVSAFAQDKGKISVGGNLSFLTDASNFGLGGKVRYGLTDQIRLEGGLNYYLPSDHVSAFEFTANAHYVFQLAPQWSVYPLAGLGYYSSRYSYRGFSSTAGEFLLNFGGGASYQLNSRLSLGAEVRYLLVDGYDTPALGLNAMFTL